MSDVTIKYNGAQIAELNGTGSKTLQTSGKYCAGDIAVEYAPRSKKYEITLAKASGWVLLTTLDSEVLGHISDETLMVSLVNLSPYAYEYYAGDMYISGNKPIGYSSNYPMYGYSNRESAPTTAVTQPIFYPANYTGTSTNIGGYGIFRVDSGKYYIQPSNGFIKAGRYRLMFTW